PGRDQGLLQRVLGILYRTQHPVAVHLQLALVGVDEPAERLPVSGPGQSDQLRGHHAHPRTPFPSLPPDNTFTGMDTAWSANWALAAAQFAGPAVSTPSTTCRHRAGRTGGSDRCPRFCSRTACRRTTGRARPTPWPPGTPGSTAWAPTWWTAATRSSSQARSATAGPTP